MFPDAAELVGGGEAGNDRVVTDGAVPGEAAVVRKDDVVPQLAIVGDVGVAEEKVVGADAGGQLRVGAAMDRAVLAEDVVGADFQCGGLADVFEILGFPADDGEGEKLVGIPEGGGAFEDDVGVQHAVIAEGHVRTDGAVGADADVPAEFGLGGDDGGGVYHLPSLG